MPKRRDDPYLVLGVRPDATDKEIRGAYRRLVQLHHPDHNGGSRESTRRFEAVQEAYAQIRELRTSAPGPAPSAAGAGTPPPAGAGTPPPAGAGTPPPPGDPDLDARLASMERELREAHLARERARRAAAEEAAAQRKRGGEQEAAAQRKRPTDEELGYIKTDDSLAKIFADARDELSEQLAELFDDARDEINRRRK